MMVWGGGGGGGDLENTYSIRGDGPRGNVCMTKKCTGGWWMRQRRDECT